jgi:tyrosinase
MVALTSLLASALACAGMFQGADAFTVTGVTTGGTQPRYELRALEANHPQMWNLFLQAMEAFQGEGQGKQTSYYQIAGIHGAPYTSWDGVRQTGSGGGYCPHSSNLFGPWHRPYLAAFEQRIAAHARSIAERFPPRQRAAYRQAARNMRLPYWDWAQNGARVMPKSMVSQGIRVTRPNGNRVTIRNPLSRYHFHPLNSGALIFAPTNSYHETKRAPQGGGPNPQSNNAAVENTFRSQRPNMRQSLYALYAQGGRYNQISNWGIGSASNNFEAIHNNIHAGFGGNSHMSLPVLAAFDPAFWLHHANVDRLLAMWQRLHPSTYVTPTQQSGGTWTIRQGSVQGPKSPLKPFHRKGGGFWTSKGARSTRSFHYTYPELADNPSQATLRARINRLYGGAVGVSKSAEPPTKRAIAETLNTVPDVPVMLNIESGDIVYSYTAEIMMPKTFNGAGYNVLLFLGAPSDDASAWLTDPNVVGFQASLGNSNGFGDPEALIPANVYLTDAIVRRYDAGEIDSLDKDTVEAYLTDNLVWRAEQNGQAIAPDAAPALTVHLVAQTVQAPETEDGFPEYQGSNSVAPVKGTRHY